MKFAMLALLYILPWMAAAQLRFGIISPHDTNAAQRWMEMESYFTGALGVPVKIVRHPPNRIGAELAVGSLDFALVNPVNAVEVIERGGAIPVATLKANGSPYFAGVIITHRTSGITSAADLKGRDVLAYQKTSAGAYAFQLYYLLQMGINPYTDLRSLRQNNKQDDIVLAVAAKRIDAGFVRTGIIEELVAEGRIQLADIVVVDERHDELKLRHTTELYPERFLMVSSKMSPALRERLQQAALAIRPDTIAARTAGIDGFVKPLSLDKVKEVMQALHMPPYGQCSPSSGKPTDC